MCAEKNVTCCIVTRSEKSQHATIHFFFPTDMTKNSVPALGTFKWAQWRCLHYQAWASEHGTLVLTKWHHGEGRQQDWWHYQLNNERIGLLLFMPRDGFYISKWLALGLYSHNQAWTPVHGTLVVT